MTFYSLILSIVCLDTRSSNVHMTILSNADALCISNTWSFMLARKLCASRCPPSAQTFIAYVAKGIQIDAKTVGSLHDRSYTESTDPAALGIRRCLNRPCGHVTVSSRLPAGWTCNEEETTVCVHVCVCVCVCVCARACQTGMCDMTSAGDCFL